MYKICDVAQKIGISSDTIRYYEKIHLLPKVKRSINGYRTYGENEIKTIKFIILCKKFGFTLNEIRPILNYFNEAKKSKLNIDNILLEKIKQVEERQKELRTLKKQLKLLHKSCISKDCSILL